MGAAAAISGRRLAIASRALGLVALAGAALAGCSNRERANPLDPENPETGGSPAGFRAVAGSGQVQLTWQLLDVPDLAGYEVLRQGPADPGYLALTPSPLSRTTSSYLDSTAGNDTTYAYRLQFRLTSGDTGGASDALARPGSSNVWVMDSAADALVRYTPDGRYTVFSLYGLNNPVALALETSSGRVWGASGVERFLALWEPTGSLVDANRTLLAPLDLAPVPASTYAWASDGGRGEVVLLDAAGTVQTRLAGFQLPYGVAYDPARLRLWVGDRDDRRLLAYDLTLTQVVNQTLAVAPWRLAFHLPSGDVWITSADGGRVERRSLAGALVAAVDGLARPFAVSVDDARDEAWVTLASGDEVICLDAGARIVRRISNLPSPRGVAVDAARDQIWVTTLGAEDGAGQLWNFGRDGTLLNVSGRLGRPFAVRLDPDRNPPP